MVARMTAAGAIMLGKTNAPAFGWIDVTGQPASSVPWAQHEPPVA